MYSTDAEVSLPRPVLHNGLLATGSVHVLGCTWSGLATVFSSRGFGWAALLSGLAKTLAKHVLGCL